MSEAVVFFGEVISFLLGLVGLLLELILFGAILARFSVSLHDSLEASLQNLVFVLRSVQVTLSARQSIPALFLLSLLQLELAID